jgi:exodeoxyribonuclease VII large subunit
MAFNEEIVVRAAAASAIPLISAVGHETDTTLIDFASDKRAPTPTAAAEMAVPVRLDLRASLTMLGGRLESGTARFLAERRLRVEGLGRGLPDPASLIEGAMQRLDDRAERLDLAIRRFLTDRSARIAETAARLKHPRERIEEATRQLDREAARLAPALARTVERASDRLARLSQVLDSLSPFKVLERGYAVVQDSGGHPVAPSAITPGMALTLRFADAIVDARAESGPHKEGEVAKPAARRKAAPAGETRQATLF